ncbi:cytochrome P450 [Amylocystis lapponica]|nr:cytochrome P450 [Amylocystis lapponica]
MRLLENITFLRSLPVPPSISLTLGVSIYVLTWLLRRFVAKSQLDSIPGPPVQSFWLGNFARLEFQRELVKNCGSVVNIKGFLSHPLLYIHDPRVLNSIIMRTDIFETASWMTESELLLFGPGLISTFDAIASEINDPREVDVVKWMGRLTLEFTGQVGRGVSFDPLMGAARNLYGDALKELLPTLYGMGFMPIISLYVSAFGPPQFRRWVLDMIPHKGLQKLKTIVDTIYNTSPEIFHAKVAAMRQGDEAIMWQIGRGQDIMTIQANMELLEGDRLTEEEVIATVSTITFAGMDTISNTLLRKEPSEAQDGRTLLYDELMQLPYLDAVCRESLRLIKKDFVLPLSEPIRGLDGTLMNEILLPKNSVVVVGVLGSNCYNTIWDEDAFEWKPERWLVPLPGTVKDARVPGVYTNLMTFIGGGRACVALSALKPIFWNMAGVNYPTMGQGSAKIELPLRVGRVKGQCPSGA